MLIPRLLLAFLLAVAVSAGAWSQDGSQPTPPVDSQSVYPSKSKHHSKKSQHAPKEPMALVNLAVSGDLNVHTEYASHGTEAETNKWTDPITLFTLLLVVVGVLQWRVYSRQTDGLREIERSWLGVDKVKEHEFQSMPEVGAPKIPTVTFAWANTGKSPAWSTSGKARLIKVKRRSDKPDPDLPTDPEYGEAWTFLDGVPINPGGFRPEQVILESGGLSQEEFAEIKQGETFIVFYGFINYRDIFRREHESRFCLVWREPAGFQHYRGFTYGGGESYNRQT